MARTISRWVLTGMALAWAATASAQVVNPRTLEFIASVDHDVTQSGQALVTTYEARWYATGATAPLSVTFLGKPTPEPTSRRIIVDVAATILAIPIGTGYVCRVAAIGPGGEGVSDPSAPFGVAVRSPAGPTNAVLRNP